MNDYEKQLLAQIGHLKRENSKLQTLNEQSERVVKACEDDIKRYEQALKDLKRMAHNTPLSQLPNVIYNLVSEVLED